MSMGEINPFVSRRNFVRMFGAGVTVAAALPSLAQSTSGAPAGQARRGMGAGADMGEMRQISPDTVIISSNENPLGPAQCALDEMIKAGPTGGRYDKFGVARATVKTISDQFGLKPGYVELYPGSGGPLDMALMSSISPDRGLVCADPSYEQGPRAAAAVKAPLKMVPLTPTFAHDVKAMVAADPKAGAFYIVNPNNPTGTMTPKEDIIWLLNNKPAGSVVIVDEAYHHFSTHESVIDQVALDKDIIVLRTFSKIYGMAGIRAGFAFARPDLIPNHLAGHQPQERSFGLPDCSRHGRLQPARPQAHPGTPQDQHRQPRGNTRVPREGRLQDCSRISGELLHGRCQASGPRVHLQHAEGRCCNRQNLVCDANLRPRYSWNRG